MRSNPRARCFSQSSTVPELTSSIATRTPCQPFAGSEPRVPGSPGPASITYRRSRVSVTPRSRREPNLGYTGSSPTRCSTSGPDNRVVLSQKHRRRISPRSQSPTSGTCAVVDAPRSSRKARRRAPRFPWPDTADVFSMLTRPSWPCSTPSVAAGSQMTSATDFPFTSPVTQRPASYSAAILGSATTSAMAAPCFGLGGSPHTKLTPSSR